MTSSSVPKIRLPRTWEHDGRIYTQVRPHEVHVSWPEEPPLRPGETRAASYVACLLGNVAGILATAPKDADD